MGAKNNVNVTLKVRHDSAVNWATKNPVLLVGEIGFETDTLLIKIGDGSTHWNNLRYLNKLDSTQFEYDNNGNIILKESAISDAGYLKRKIVNTLPLIAEAEDNIIYMIKNISALGPDKYEEYILINGAFEQIGDTSIPIATAEALGGVKSSLLNNHIKVDNSGFMTVNNISTSLLYVPLGDELVLNGGQS